MAFHWPVSPGELLEEVLVGAELGGVVFREIGGTGAAGEGEVGEIAEQLAFADERIEIGGGMEKLGMVAPEGGELVGDLERGQGEFQPVDLAVEEVGRARRGAAGRSGAARASG